MNMKKYLRAYIDTETTGTEKHLHHAHQVSGLIVSPDFQIVDSFNLEFRPASLENISKEALEKCRLSVEQLNARPMSHREAHKAFTDILGKHINKYDKQDKAHLIGFKVGFDADFLRKWFSTCGDDYFGSWFWNPPIDLLSTAAWLLGDGRGALPNFKLGTVCQAAGLEWSDDNAHDAFYDIKKTFELDKYLKGNFTS